MKLYNLWYFLKEGIKSIFRHFFHSTAAVMVMCACLLITGTFSLITHNISVLVNGLSAKNEINVFIDESLSRKEALMLEYEIMEIPNIAAADFVTKETLLDEWLEQLGEDAYVLEDLKNDNPLRDSYRIYMKDIALHEETVNELMEIEGIASSNSQKDLSDRLVQIRGILSAASAVLIFLLGGVSIFIIYNTVRLAMFSRKDEIGIMKMVGATDGFIRAPFIIEGAFLGITAGVVTYFLQLGVYSYIQKELIKSSGLFELIPFGEVSSVYFMIFIISGFVLGTLGSAMSIRKFLRV